MHELRDGVPQGEIPTEGAKPSPYKGICKKPRPREGVQRNGATTCAWPGCGTILNSYNQHRYCCCHMAQSSKIDRINDERKYQDKLLRDRKTRKAYRERFGK